ncbi:MAG: C40 family peptidase [Bacteroidetes bacterium]|jgi:gamma-D-glutamyl-L-lysine dipeptidyl-peptidase|nr:C40 family peptidase [Bacteroidota bacterium]MBT4401414.1 C40 family peptidase [Bacteroidota bacterium]MBT4410648.1 C40 family peptidase [Bacteroidota bacterium]MBT7093660.1 C40 family peptidase [Bacteroidota bacterium]MBT7464237.1 C40 family peptidase [Bacteroidota bacterium]
MNTTFKRYGIVPISCLSVYKEADHTSEMLNQLLFGECFEILNGSNDWVEIQSLFDKSTGWVQSHSFLQSDEPGPLLSDKSTYITSQTVILSRPGYCSYTFTILPGSSLPCPPRLGHSFELAGVKFRFETPVPEPPALEGASSIEALALVFIHSPYHWGGRSIFGIDSSGLIQMVAKLQRHSLPRYLSEQVQLGQPLSFVQDAKAGDLAFFDNEEGEIIHAGIISGPGKIIHAAEYVREDSIDHAGIFDKNLNKYTYTLRLINRLDLK